MKISMKLDLGKAPSVLQALADERNMQKVSNAAAESWNDDAHNWVDDKRAFTPRHGQAGLEGFNWRPAGGGVAEVYATKDYSRFAHFAYQFPR